MTTTHTEREMKMKLTYGRTFTALAAAFSLAFQASCTHEILPDFCTSGIPLKVEVAASASAEDDDITGNDISGVMLYVFDNDETLLEVIPTRVGNTEILRHPGFPSLHVVAVANTSACSIPELTCGTSKLSHGEVCVNPLGTKYDGLDISDTPDDLFWGSVTVDNTPDIERGTVELPIRRMIAGVYVRVKNLRREVGDMQATDGRFRIMLGVPHSKIDFRGTPCSPTRAASDPVNHLFTGSFRNISGGEYFEAPGQNTVTKAAEFHRIIATDQGCPVTLGIYHNDTLVTSEPITADDKGNPLRARNGKLNTITVFFGDDGSIEVTVNESEWGSAPPIIKEF